ncbi:single-stranded-DNA-specific exonuclease RecJ [Variovorax sp. LT1P1]|uniref:single-stranded-DNA-specific exonuclease RecJ n=1 Tax=Variovorax sp. LT1P1 TaxID=3443730 RepID=UPI003F4974BC
MLARLFAARGITDVRQVRASLNDMLPIDLLKNAAAMGSLLADCLASQARVLIVADYDCDGATAASVLLKAFRGIGLNHSILVPDRVRHGYGLTPSIVEEAAALPARPDFIVTVDNGISSIQGVARASALGIDVLVTDHHLCGDELPAARLIVNPNQPGCTFPSKAIAGCGVAWYVACALHRELLARGVSPGFEPADLLQYVALGTVADVVPLDYNNRILVRAGLSGIRSERCVPGIKALAAVAECDPKSMTCMDIGYRIAPRINAAGRLAHMSAGIECLTNEGPDAGRLAADLDQINASRKEIQAEMIEAAVAMADQAAQACTGLETEAVVVYEPGWHEGVVGIVAGRLKDLRHRPSFVLCDSADGNVKGSGRSIPGLHLKHALDQINVQHPGLLLKFGGHAMAAGVTIAGGQVSRFRSALEAVCAAQLTDAMKRRTLHHDGALPAQAINPQCVAEMLAEVWGEGFPAPLFVDTLDVLNARAMGANGSHLKVKVGKAAAQCDLIAWGEGVRKDALPRRVQVAFTPALNQYRGNVTVQFIAKDLLNVERTSAMPTLQPPRAQPSLFRPS